MGHEAVHLTGRPINWAKPPAPNAIVKWTKKDTGGDTVKGSFRHICHLNRLDRLSAAKFGKGIQIIQPAYNTTVRASAGTHDFDACVDLYIPGIGWWDMQAFLRANGLACWYRRPPTFGNHIHGFTLPQQRGATRSQDFDARDFKVGKYVDGGWSTAGRKTTSAQIDDYYAHRSGLAGHAKDSSWFPKDISATIFNLTRYVTVRR